MAPANRSTFSHEIFSAAAPAAWDEADEQLREATHALREHVDTRVQTTLDAIEQERFGALQRTAHEAAAVHAALLKTSGADAGTAPSDTTLQWKRVRNYRRDAMTRVIQPVRAHLTETNLGTALHDLWAACWADLAPLSNDLPITITRSEPSDLYTPGSKDTTWTRARKAFVRWQRRLHIGAKPAFDGTAYAQQVPLRKLAAYHLRVRLPQALAPHEAALQQRFAHAVATFERAVTTWTHRLLNVERLLNQAAHHAPTLPDDLPEPDKDVSASEPSASDDVWQAAWQEATMLNQQLYALATLDFEECPKQVMTTVETSWAAFAEDLDQADSFLLDQKDRTLPTPKSAPEGETTPAETPWTHWHREAADRLRFCQQLADLHDTITTDHDALLQTLAKTIARPVATACTESVTTLRALHAEAKTLLDAPSHRDNLRTALADLLDRCTEITDQTLIDTLQQARLQAALREAIDDTTHRITERLDASAGPLTLHALAAPEADRIDPAPETRTVDLAALAAPHFDALFADRLRIAAEPLQQRLNEVLAALKEVSHLLQFNLGAALEELDEADAGPVDADTLKAVRAFVFNGLERSENQITEQATRVREVFPVLTHAIGATFDETWTHLHDRARAEGRVREHLAEIRSVLRYEIQERSAATERSLQRTRLRLERFFRRSRSRAEELVRLGQTAVGVGPFSESAFLETMAALSTFPQTLEDLPLVYRRLFSFRPITADPSLLTGRENDLLVTERHIEQWKQGLTNALLFTGLPGSGRTSFLNVVRKTQLRDATVHTLELDDRLRTEAAFARRVADALRLSLPAPVTLDRLREHLLAQPRPNVPRVCIMDRLEHLFLRTVHGTELVARVLTFMSRTDSRVLWLSTISDGAWQILLRAEPAASRLIFPHRLAPLDRAALETLILTRHRRSGFRLHFDLPDTPTPLLRRRLHNATPEEQQALLQDEYFTRLATQCGANIMLALFYWVRSVRLDEETLTIHVQPLQPLSFDFLEHLSMEQTFVLKALLDHATLTVEEYAEAAQLPLATSLDLFESLGNVLLIEPVDPATAPGTPAFSTVEPDRRYRIRPLLIQPVTKFLRARNILH